MRSVRVGATGFAGTTSRPAAGIANASPNCSRCGSSLAGRLEPVRRGKDWTVLIWRCPCGRRRRLRRPAKAEAGGRG